MSAMGGLYGEYKRGPYTRVSVRVRHERREEAEVLARLFLESATYHETEIDAILFRQPDYEKVVDAFRGNLPPFDGTTFVAESEDEVIGFAEVKLFRPSLEADMHRPNLYGMVEELAVAGASRRQGTGGLLMMAAENWAREQGAVRMILDSHPRNERAVRFYRDAMGYETTGLRFSKPL